MTALENQFTEIMIKRTDAELIEIVTKLRNDYQPEALIAAEIEVEKRNLSAEKIDQLSEEIEHSQQKIQEKANQKLDVHWKILCFLFPGFINIILALIFKGQGQDRKYKEAWHWTFYGFAFYIGMVLLFMVLFSLLK